MMYNVRANTYSQTILIIAPQHDNYCPSLYLSLVPLTTKRRKIFNPIYIAKYLNINRSGSISSIGTLNITLR